MNFRSANGRFVHYGGDVLSNTDDSSHGVHLAGGSTGGIVQPCGDETNIGLNVRAKGTGPVRIGQLAGSTQPVHIGSSGATVFIAGSVAGFGGFITATDTAVATPNFATTNAMVIETTHVIVGLGAQTLGAPASYYVVAQPHNLSTDCALVGAFVGSTATELHCRFAKLSTLTVAATTATISFLVIRT